MALLMVRALKPKLKRFDHQYLKTNLLSAIVASLYGKNNLTNPVL